MLVTLFIKMEQNSYLYMAITNLLFILQLFILLQGFSLIFYISHVKGWVKAIPIITCGCIIIKSNLAYD